MGVAERDNAPAMEDERAGAAARRRRASGAAASLTPRHAQSKTIWQALDTMAGYEMFTGCMLSRALIRGMPYYSIRRYATRVVIYVALQQEVKAARKTREQCAKRRL